MARSAVGPSAAGPWVLVAPDSFKGTLDAHEVASALANGLRAHGVQADECPVGDGGEGTTRVLVERLGGELREADVRGPLGRRVRAEWGLLGAARATAVVESSRASGLSLLAEAERDAERASSVGTGELMLAAAAAGARRILVAVGGTATSDGGAGALAVVLEGGGLAGVELIALCDVAAGFELAAPVFAPQKGADAATVARLQARLDALAACWPRDPRGVPMTGAGGGLAGGLWACLGAELRSGADFVLDALGVRDRIAAADAVIVGEGRLDAQSLGGKALGAIARLARESGVPVHAIVGGYELTAHELAALGLSSVREAGTTAALELAAGELAVALTS